MIDKINKILPSLALIVIVVFGLVLVGNKQPVQEELLKGVTNYDVTQVRWVATPDPDTGTITYRTTRRCTLTGAVGSNFCNIQNDTTGRWYVTSSLVVSKKGTATTTFAQISVATSTAALANMLGSFPYGYSTTTFATAPIKISLGTTTGYGMTTGERVFDILPAKAGIASSSRAIPLDANEYLNCSVIVPRRGAGKIESLWEKATSTSFGIQTECLFEIFSTTTPSNIGL